MKQALSILAAVLLLCGTAMSMEPGLAPVKSKQKAVRLSLAATLIPAAAGVALASAAPSEGAQVAGIGLVALGLSLGPSAGRIYADGSFSRSLAVGRLVGVGLAVAGLAAATNERSQLLEEQTHGWKSTGSLVVAGAGLALVSVNAIRDIVAASRAVSVPKLAKSGVDWNVGAKYFAADKAIGASVTFKF